jgi:hypothetical protein
MKSKSKIYVPPDIATQRARVRELQRERYALGALLAIVCLSVAAGVAFGVIAFWGGRLP